MRLVIMLLTAKYELLIHFSITW